MKIVTTGLAYLDIDSYAGCIAYAELLLLQGQDAIAASSAPLNHSVTASLRGLGKKLSDYVPSAEDEFVMIDISAREFFDPIVGNGEVVEIIDHHPGYEDYWKEKLGDKAQIEVVGAACTQVVERWQEGGKLEQMDQGTATLLAAGILDNTLNFAAGVTQDRDHQAYEALKRIANLPENFAASYFSECQAAIEADIVGAVKGDMKEQTSAPNLPRFLGQIIVWDARSILQNDQAVIKQVMSGFGSDWGLNMVSIVEAKSYFLAVKPETQQMFSGLFDVTFTGGISTPNAMMLRKEIFKTAIDKLKHV